ncbi:MAG: hypothetical protein ACREF0_17105 [Acetobacteraceae bacterium]
MVHPDVRVARLVMAGAAKEWLWVQPEELGLESAKEDDRAAWESAESRERMERTRIEERRAALLLWWAGGRMGTVRFWLFRVVQIVLRPVGRLRRSARWPA